MRDVEGGVEGARNRGGFDGDVEVGVADRVDEAAETELDPVEVKFTIFTTPETRWDPAGITNSATFAPTRTTKEPTFVPTTTTLPMFAAGMKNVPTFATDSVAAAIPSSSHLCQPFSPAR